MRPLTLALLAAPALPQDDARHALSPELQAAVNTAIDRGVDALLAQQELDGSWGHAIRDYPGGSTALVVYTLLKCGVPPEHAAVRRGIAFVRGTEFRKTYSASCAILALVANGDGRDDVRIQELADQLVTWLTDDGHAYPHGHPDLSNTQYATLALRTAARAGTDVDRRVWSRIVDAVLEYQEAHEAHAPAGFSYRPGQPATGSMTAGGVGALAMCREQARRLPRGTDAAIDGGRRWLAEHFLADGNPCPVAPGRANGWRYYYLYGVERVCGVLDLPRLGEHEWYRAGAEYLVRDQRDDGTWDGNQPNTAFALLFLARATSGAPVSGVRAAQVGRFGRDDPAADLSLRASGTSELTMWISSVGGSLGRRATRAREAGDPLVVERVEWYARPAGVEAEPTLLGALEGRGPVDSGERYPLRHRFEKLGDYTVTARLRLAPTADDSARRREIESTPLDVTVRRFEESVLARYEGDRAQNRMPPDARATATSQANDGELSAKSACDGLVATCWRSKDDDPLPVLTIELPRTVRAERILLSHAFRMRSPDLTHTARAHRVRVVLNESKRHVFELEMDPRDAVKTEIEIPRTLRIRRIDVEVLEARGATGDRNGVGFSEVELLGR